MNFIVTGGAGFIGSAVIRNLINHSEHKVLNIDSLTYAGNLDSLVQVSKSSRYFFVKEDIRNNSAIRKIFNDFKPDIIMHLAAESHVDRSIDGPKIFIETNILGTFNLLNEARLYWQSLSGQRKENFRFHHISTDEVYGDLDSNEAFFKEDTCYDPSSPYSASKASSDHLVRAWNRTYGLPVVITNCSNNYGPYQFPEKLIPHIILNAIKGKSLPVYGDGKQIRDWLHVDDHADALILAGTKAKAGKTYNIGGHNEVKNIDVVKSICSILEEIYPNKPSKIDKYTDLITFVEDRPGHDVRYAIDATKIHSELGWKPKETFVSGLSKTVLWYITNENWWERVLSGDYKLGRIGNSA